MSKVGLMYVSDAVGLCWGLDMSVGVCMLGWILSGVGLYYAGLRGLDMFGLQLVLMLSVE